MYLTRRFFLLLAIAIVVTAFGHVLEPLYIIGIVAFIAILLLCGIELVFLYSYKHGISSKRIVAERLSNGDENKISILISSTYPIKVKTEVIDEVPFIFQRRDLLMKETIKPQEKIELHYSLTPKRRGTYEFGQTRVFASVLLHLAQRRFSQNNPCNVKVYPSYVKLSDYQILSSNTASMAGQKKIRKVGNNTEFEQIKDYITGDDYRHINWKASAKSTQLKVNIYQDEKSQQIVSVIDKGRTMQQSFNEMTLLDYSINSALALSHVAFRKGDIPGVVLFDEKMGDYLPPEKHSSQMSKIMEMLYNVQTNFGESDFSGLCINLLKRVKKRSLIVLYTSIATINALERQIKYLQLINSRHCLLVVFFMEDKLTEKSQEIINNSEGATTEEYYQAVIAEKLIYDKKIIANKLIQHGIFTILTTPDKLTTSVINKYIELKRNNSV